MILRNHLLITVFLFIELCNCNELCGGEYGCWSVPPGCSPTECTASVGWTVNGTTLRLQIQATLLDVPHTGYGAYVAIGFSHDNRMGEDTVIDCVYDGREELRPFLSYNDGLHNAQLHAATELMITDVNATAFEGKILCDIELDFEQRHLLSEIDKLKVHDVISQPIYLQMARGVADPYTFAKKKHSLWDGSVYPWTSSKPILLMSGHNGYESIESAFQSASIVSRNLTYVMVTLHSLLMLWGWWFFASNAILIARYCKLSWPETNLCGAAVWFQVHRNFMVLSVVLQVTAFLFVVTQAGFSFYFWCTMQCTMEHFSKPAHTWSGLTAFGLAVIQPFFAWIRPSGISKWRRTFNCLHWFIGMTSFIVASVAMIFAIPLGKTALAKHYAKRPNLLMGSYLVLFTMTSIVMEILVSLTVITSKRDMTSAAVIYTRVPAEERPTRRPHFVFNRRMRVFVLFVHAAGSIFICSRLSEMLIENYFRSH